MSRPKYRIKYYLLFFFLLAINMAVAQQRINSQYSPPQPFSVFPGPLTPKWHPALNNRAFADFDTSSHVYNPNLDPAYSGVLDTCATYTYRLVLGNAGSEEWVNEITTIDSGHSLLTGKVKSSDPFYDALLIKLDENGRLLWSKSYGEPGLHEEFHKARKTADGGFICIGSVYTDLTGNSWVLISKMDRNGVQEWTRRFQSPVTGTIAKGMDITQMADGNYLFTGDNSQSLFFGKMSGNGTLIWSKSAAPFPVVKSNCILEDYNGHFVVASGTEGGFNVSIIFKINLTNGDFVWGRKFGGAASNSHFIFHKTVMINLRPRITGIVSVNGQPYQFIRITINTGSPVERMEIFDTPGIVPDITAFSALIPWSEVMIFSATASSTDLKMVKNGPDLDDVEWSRKVTVNTPVRLAAIEKTYDGGFITAVNKGDDILLIKTDSTGFQPGCDVTSLSNTSNTLLNFTIPTFSFPIPDAIWAQNNNNLAENGNTTDTVYECRQLTCPPRPIEDPCMASFYKTYRSYVFGELPIGMRETGDNHIMISGLVRQNNYDASSQIGMIIKATKKGDLVDKRRWRIGLNNTFLKQIRLADGNHLVAGVATDNGFSGYTLTKFDDNLNIIWHKFYRQAANIIRSFHDITEAPNGDLFVTMGIPDFPNLNDRIAISRLDNNGTLIWDRSYRSSSGVSALGVQGTILADASGIYVNNYCYISNGSWATVIIKINQTSGNLLWAKKYAFDPAANTRPQNLRLSGNKLFLSGSVDHIPNQYSTFLARLSTEGDFEKMSIQQFPSHSYQFRFSTTANSEIVISEYIYDYTQSPPGIYDYFLRLDSNLNIINSKKINSRNQSFTYAQIESSEGDIFATGANFYDNPYNSDIFIKRHLSNGMLGDCASDTLIVPTTPATLTVSNLSYVQAIVSTMQDQPSQVVETPFTLQQSLLHCGAVTNCDTIWLEGPELVCDSTNQFIYRARKNAGCMAQTQWTISGATVQVLQTTDSLIRLKFIQNGIVKIYSKIYAGCEWLEDSLEIQVQLAPDTLDLGPDKGICPNNQFTLNAGTGYSSYLWQDGSVTPTYSVTVPGLYWVEVTDACNNIFRDSILIDPIQPPALELGPDLSKCNNDSILITAPAGFTTYSWSPAYNISSTSGQIVTVFPTTDTMYRLTAESSPGCFSYDSVRVFALRSVPVHLGPDASFCNGDSLILNAGAGFIQYQWNTGATTQQIVAKNAGNYLVSATDANGCSSKDSLQVLSVYSNPVVNLGPDVTICDNEVKRLQAGNGFANYLWSNGSNVPFIDINQPGTYWVIVSSQNNCRGTDSISISGLLPSPKHFLPADTMLCNYTSITLSPLTSFNRYLWNTGSTTQNLLISAPGVYWLEVAGNNGCSGKDSILVSPKDCLQGFYIPNAFTPNNDGLNDQYKPLLFGPVVYYDFRIYNRWGELVFQSNDPRKGWNGSVRQSQKDSHVYTWYCHYQLMGKPAELRKGTVVLIR